MLTWREKRIRQISPGHPLPIVDSHVANSSVTSQVIFTINRQGMDPLSQELLPTPLYCVLDMVNKDPLIGPGQNISTNLVVDLSKDIGIG